MLCSSYIEDFVLDSGIIDASNKNWALMLVWIAIAMGRFGGLYDQIKINALGQKGIQPLYFHLVLWISAGLVGGLLWFAFPHSERAFWLGIVLYGFGNGPCVGYCYDLNNRLTMASEKGMSIVMFGLNFGASIVPYAATLAWDHTSLSYKALPIAVVISMALPLPLLFFTRPINDIAGVVDERKSASKCLDSSGVLVEIAKVPEEV